MKLYYSDGEKEKMVEIKEKKGLGYIKSLMKLAHQPRNMRMVKCEGEGELADFFREQIKEMDEKGENFKVDKDKLYKILMKGMI